MTVPPQPDAEEISGVLKRVNLLGTATERLFSYLYTGLNRRSQRETQERTLSELQQKIDHAKRIQEQNKRLQFSVAMQAGEIERLHGILATLNDGIIMQDTEGQVIFINKAARELLGTQKNIWDTQIGMLFEKYRDIDQLESEVVPLGATEQVQVNNRIVGTQVAAVANDAGQRIGTMLILRDMTQDTVADRLKDQFVTAISHELKTPMTVIKGMSEVLMGQPEDRAPNRRLLETLSRNVDILDRMVVELLDVSEMGAETFEIRQNPINIEPIVWRIVNGMTPEVKKNRLQVSLMAKETSNLQVRGDEQRLRWAIGHLFKNSVYYTLPEGRVWVRVRPDDQKQNVVIEFIDEGVGISGKDMPHIFERFYRGDPRDSSGRLVDPRGLGQGLFIAKTVIEAHGGYINVGSDVGVGSVFTVTLPIDFN